MKSKYSNLTDLFEAREVVISQYGATCEAPFAYFIPEQPEAFQLITFTEQQAKYYLSIKEDILELRAVVEILEALKNHTWMYQLGFRAGVEKGKIIPSSIEWHQQNLHRSAWIVLAKRLGVWTDQETIEEVIEAILGCDLVSDFEQGINWVFRPEDITGSGSDAIDPDGRIRLQQYFDLPKYADDFNSRLVSIFDRIRRQSPKVRS